ncbi:hypothetical protein [Blastococcus sp. VKM Ac-2987]|uniref:hypothetical protein n=1 Tax=Blastococcus sp. VKM Ac-2987 TaxID=3004141 RepID=UPI0022AB9596|nr:hypothetical protein [Blastococcus sp. VKM Ac-2987]MCZ2860153.1 hypothetical protein [Blastococcus sp. VKM Ac-2987]
MTGKPLRCHLGLHSWLSRHPADERYDGPDQKVCRRCGKERGLPFGVVPPGPGGSGSGDGGGGGGGGGMT